jgi:Tol biopolymer transport system component
VGERILDGIYPSGVQWSPKGTSLVYVEADNRASDARSDQSQIVIQPAAPGAEASPLARGREAVFSPDGEWIVYATPSGKLWRLARVRPDGSGRRPIGESSRHQRNPAVSPDGRHVAYVSKVGSIDHLYLRRMDGSGDRILLNDGSVAFPVW